MLSLVYGSSRVTWPHGSLRTLLGHLQVSLLHRLPDVQAFTIWRTQWAAGGLFITPKHQLLFWLLEFFRCYQTMWSYLTLNRLFIETQIITGDFNKYYFPSPGLFFWIYFYLMTVLTCSLGTSYHGYLVDTLWRLLCSCDAQMLHHIKVTCLRVSTCHGRKISSVGEDALYPQLLQSLPQVNLLLHFEAGWIWDVD